MTQQTREHPLTDRELELLHLVATGATNHQIAKQLFISVNTVKVHLRNIFEKMGVESRTEAVTMAIREGWIAIEGTGEQPAATTPDVSNESLPRIALWQRLFLMATALLIFGISIWLPSIARQREFGPVSPFTERSPSSSALVSDERVARWNTLPSMRLPRGRHAAVYHEGKIYVIGGDSDESIIGDMEVYDLATRQWSMGPEKPTRVGNIGASVAAGKIWVPGGFLPNGHITNAVETYDPRKGTWEQAPSLPEPLCAYALAEVEDNLYLFGGANSQRYLDIAYRFNTTTQQWESLPPLPSPRAFSAAASANGLIFVLGGYDGQRELASCLIFDPQAWEAGLSPWSECPSLTAPRGGCAAAGLGDILYVVGGGWKGFMAYNEQYRLGSARWEPFASPIVGEWRNLALVADDRTLYAIGGWDGHYSGGMWAYQAIVTIFLPIAP